MILRCVGVPGRRHDGKVRLGGRPAPRDRGANSPHAGNVYVCWARFTASGPNNGVWLPRSSDGGLTFTSQKISDNVHGNQFCDIAVTSSDAVYVAWRQFDFKPDQGQLQSNGIVWVRSDDGGKKFTKPVVATPFVGWDPGDQTFDPVAHGQAKFDACQVGDGTLGRMCFARSACLRP